MSDEAKDFHDDWREFLNEEEELEELFGRTAGAQMRNLRNKAAGGLDSAWKGTKKQFSDAGKTMASKVGAGAHGQLSFKDQEAAWKGMSNLPDWTNDPAEVKKHSMMANSKNLAQLGGLAEWYLTLEKLAKETEVTAPLEAMNSLAFWWLGRNAMSKADAERWASMEYKAKTLAQGWPKDSNEIELDEDGKSVVFRAPIPNPSFAGAPDIMVLHYLNNRYVGKSYAEIDEDWPEGKKALIAALKTGPLKSLEDYSQSKYEKDLDGLRALGTAVYKGVNSSVVPDLVAPEWPPSEAPSEEEPPEEIDLAAEGIGDVLEREAAELLISESRLAELSFPSLRRGTKKKCPKTPDEVLEHDFVLSQPLVKVRTIEHMPARMGDIDVIPSLKKGMQAMWDSQGLNNEQRLEVEKAYNIWQPKLQIAFEGSYDKYIKLLIKLWKTRLDEVFIRYKKLRRKADKLKCKREAAGEGGEGDAPTPEEVPTPTPVRESVEDRWKRLALL